MPSEGWQELGRGRVKQRSAPSTIYEIEKQDESEIKTLRPGFLLSSDEKRWRGEKKRNVRRNAR